MGERALGGVDIGISGVLGATVVGAALWWGLGGYEDWKKQQPVISGKDEVNKPKPAPKSDNAGSNNIGTPSKTETWGEWYERWSDIANEKLLG